MRTRMMRPLWVCCVGFDGVDPDYLDVSFATGYGNEEAVNIKFKRQGAIEFAQLLTSCAVAGRAARKIQARADLERSARDAEKGAQSIFLGNPNSRPIGEFVLPARFEREREHGSRATTFRCLAERIRPAAATTSSGDVSISFDGAPFVTIAGAKAEELAAAIVFCESRQNAYVAEGLYEHIQIDSRVDWRTIDKYAADIAAGPGKVGRAAASAKLLKAIAEKKDHPHFFRRAPKL